MRILVTGSNGFIGKNITSTLKAKTKHEIYTFDREDSLQELDEVLQKVDFIFHLAGVNRPQSEEEFFKGNHDLTKHLIERLEIFNRSVPIMLSSSIQAEKENPYGQSKRLAEKTLQAYHMDTGAKVYIYRFPNLFGKWSKPFYNSVIATWSYLIARDEPIEIDDPKHGLNLVYIDDLVDEMLRLLEGKGHCVVDNYYTVPISYQRTLGEIAELLKSFKESRLNRFIPNMADDFTRKLYSTYLNYLPEDAFSYPLVMHQDERGSFTEFVKSYPAGQVSINVSKPGITRGQHWHHSKNEKFLVVSGEAKIQFRDIFSEEVIEYFVSGEKLEVVDIPTGYTHNIINVGERDLVTVMWVNEPFDPKDDDTYPEEV